MHGTNWFYNFAPLCLLAVADVKEYLPTKGGNEDHISLLALTREFKTLCNLTKNEFTLITNTTI